MPHTWTRPSSQGFPQVLCTKWHLGCWTESQNRGKGNGPQTQKLHFWEKHGSPVSNKPAAWIWDALSRFPLRMFLTCSSSFCKVAHKRASRFWSFVSQSKRGIWDGRQYRRLSRLQVGTVRVVTIHLVREVTKLSVQQQRFPEPFSVIYDGPSFHFGNSFACHLHEVTEIAPVLKPIFSQKSAPVKTFAQVKKLFSSPGGLPCCLVKLLPGSLLLTEHDVCRIYLDVGCLLCLNFFSFCLCFCS